MRSSATARLRRARDRIPDDRRDRAEDEPDHARRRATELRRERADVFTRRACWITADARRTGERQLLLRCACCDDLSVWPARLRVLSSCVCEQRACRAEFRSRGCASASLDRRDHARDRGRRRAA